MKEMSEHEWGWNGKENVMQKRAATIMNNKFYVDKDENSFRKIKRQ